MDGVFLGKLCSILHSASVLCLMVEEEKYRLGKLFSIRVNVITLVVELEKEKEKCYQIETRIMLSLIF